MLPVPRLSDVVCLLRLANVPQAISFPRLSVNVETAVVVVDGEVAVAGEPQSPS